MTVRKYSSRSQKTALSAALTSSGTTATVVSGTSLMGGTTISVGETFTVVIDPDTALEEIVDITAISTNTLTIQRGRDGSSGVAHSAGAEVRHMAIARDYTEANQHSENNTLAHGITLNTLIKNTDTNVITSAMIVDGTIVNADINASAAIADTKLATIATSGKVSNSATTATAANTNSAIVARDSSGNFTANQITAAKVTGLSAPASGTEAANKTYVDAILGSSTAASASAAAAADSATAAGNSATAAAASAVTANTRADTATTQATNAANSASAASSSASNASSSASSASGSAGTATTQATNASNSATAASNSASAASTSATNASNSATAAAGSATDAAASLASVEGQVGSGLARDMGSITEADTSTGDWIDLTDVSAAAASSATAAASSASSASTSATTASNSATTATTQATNASNSATASATSATNSANSATAAATSATNSANSATASATSAALAATVVASAVSGTLIDAKGDLLVGTADDTVTRLPVGTNGYLLTADSAETPGIKWAAAPVSLPTQTGQTGKYLTTDGSTASWATIAADIESVTAGTGLSGGGTAGAVTVSLNTSSIYVVPSQTTHSGKFLTTDGSAASWVSLSDWGTL